MWGAAAPERARCDGMRPALPTDVFALLPLLVLASAPSHEALLAQAWRENPAVARAAAEVALADAELTSQRVLLPNPELHGAATSDVVFANRGELALEVALVQELSWPGARWARIEAAQERVRAARLRLALARLQVAADLEGAAGALAAANETHAIMTQLADSARAFADAARRRAEAGAAGDVEATLALADEASVRAQLSASGAEKDAAVLDLCALVAREDCTGLHEGSWPSLAALPELAPSSLGRADVLAASAAQRAADHEVTAALLSRIPSVRAGLGYGFGNSVFDASALTDQDQLLTVTLAVTLPVWDQQAGEVERARGESARAQADSREALLRAHTSVAAALSRLRSASEAEVLLHVVEPAVSKALVDVERAYVAGGLSLAEALAARDRLLRTRIEGVASKKRKVQAHAAALAALADPAVVGVEVTQ